MKKLCNKFILGLLLVTIFIVTAFSFVRLISPAAYLYSNGTNYSIIFKYNYTGTIGTNNFNCTLFIDGINSGYNKSASVNATSPTAASLFINKSVAIRANHSIAAGSHYWNVTCQNSTGTKQYSNISRLIIDRTAPTVSLLSPANKLNSSSTSQTFTWNVTDIGSDLTLNCTLRVNGTGVVNGVSNTIGSNRSVVLVANNSIGSHIGTYPNKGYTWNVTCIDNATNRGISSIRAFRVDTLKPNVSSVVNRTKYNEDTRYNFWINASDANAGIKNCSFYANGISMGVMSYSAASTTANRSLIFAVPKNYTVFAKCTDTAGNTNSTGISGILVINDTKNPGIVTSSASASALSIDFAINTDDYVNFSLRYGSTASRSGQNLITVATIKAQNFTHTISGLTENTLYYYNLSVCDLKDRCNVSSSSVTTSNNAGGGSSGSSSSTTTTTTTTTVTEPLITGITPVTAETITTPVTSGVASGGSGSSGGAAGAGQAGIVAPTTQKETGKAAAPVATTKVSFFSWLKSLFARLFGVFS